MRNVIIWHWMGAGEGRGALRSFNIQRNVWAPLHPPNIAPPPPPRYSKPSYAYAKHVRAQSEVITEYLVGCCWWFNGPLRQYFNLYRAVSQREGGRREKWQIRDKMSKHPPSPAPTASEVGPCPTIIQIIRTPWHWKLCPAPSHHPPSPYYRINNDYEWM